MHGSSSLFVIFYLTCSYAYMMSRYASIYTPGSSTSFYPTMLKLLYGINSSIRKEGILAPGMNSIQNTKKLYDLIGQPLDNIPTIHVGGTNGKGTTSFKLSECLRRSGYKTGLFVSPHISSFRERVQVNAELISEESVCSNLSKLMKLCATHEIPATEFELAFLLASLHFKESNCQAVVLEVGCGGLFDATNVVSTAASVICSVSLDHTRILGGTIQEIARNKAGIFKPGRPALVGPDVPLPEVREVAEWNNAVLYSYQEAVQRYQEKGWVGDKLHYPAGDAVTTSAGSDVIVDTDGLNADLTLLTLCMLKEHHPAFASLDLCSSSSGSGSDNSGVSEGMLTRPPCRWETLSHDVTTESGEKRRIKVILDLGHNPAAVSALSRRIKRDLTEENCTVRVVYAMCRDKDVLSCLKSMLTTVPKDHIHFVQSEISRASSREELSALFKQVTGEDMIHLKGNTIRESLAEVFQLAAADAITPEGVVRESVVVVCGTSFIMPETKAFLGIVEPRDAVDLKRPEPQSTEN